MTLTQEQLHKYAEQGVKTRLQEIHAELNELALHFPQIVAAFTNPASREPAMKVVPRQVMAPVVAKPGRKPNGSAKTAGGKSNGKVHHTQTPEWRAMMSAKGKAAWRRKKAEEKAAGA